jgi:hypothetical protein
MLANNGIRWPTAGTTSDKKILRVPVRLRMSP